MITSREFLRLGTLLVALVMLVGAIDRLRRPDALSRWFPDATSAAKRTAVRDAKGPEAASANNPLGLAQVDECLDVDYVLLDRVVDRTPPRAEEAAPQYQLLCVASTQSEKRKPRSPRRDVLIANLLKEPATYRGELLHVEGVLVRLLAWENQSLRNPHGLPAYYEGWIFPDEQPDHPLVVLFTGLPEGLEPGDHLRENVSIDAYFLKLEVYKGREGQRITAPKLIGGALRWRRVDPVTLSGGALAVMAGLLALLVLGILTYGRWSRRDDQLARRMKHDSAAGPDLAPHFLEESAATSIADSRIPDQGAEEHR